MRAASSSRHPGATWAIVLIALVAGAGLGVGGASLRTPTYSSSAELSWDPSALRYTDASAYVPDSVSLGIDVDTQATKVVSDQVINASSKALGVTSTSLRKSVTATASASSTLITVTAAGSSPAQARKIVQTVIGNYQTEVSSDLSAQLVKQAAQLQTPIDTLRQQLAAAPSGGSLASNLSNQLASLITQQVVYRSQADASDSISPLSVVQAPTLPDSIAGPSAAVLGIIGAALGLVIGIGIVALLRMTTWARPSRVESLESSVVHRDRDLMAV
ncbi:hypothetical protein [Frondihabitans australicus]|uniref:Capsular polysaccharide biosynthesis protein n=1 Tax=Frondihabitans australicus TaxID=386892 RepID=A0A495IDK0_9MICO|nr:hypothetical protein [Frondihabitans australicus]RKR73548.1 hypothetical protein C8E83_0641 [Frondihabitans australicus]